MDFAGQLLKETLAGTRLHIHSSVLPSLSVDLSTLVGDAPPSPLVRLARPVLELERNGQTLYRAAPAGEPAEWTGWVVVGAAAVVVGWLVWRAFR